MLEALGKKHKLWVSMGINIGIPRHLVEDFVHELYLRLDKYIKDESKVFYKETKEINRFYIWVTLRNMWISYQTRKSKNPTASLEDIYEGDEKIFKPYIYEETNKERLSSSKRLVSKIEKEVDSWDYWYDRKLFQAYYLSDLSMRQLSEETTISLTSIFHSCKKYKEYIKNKFEEDYEDFSNGDYNLI